MTCKVFACCYALTLFLQPWMIGQQTEVKDLRQAVLDAIRPTDYNEGEVFVSFEERLNRIGEREEVGDELLELVRAYRGSTSQDYPGAYRFPVSIAALRVLGIKKAAPLLREIASDTSALPRARSEAVRALGVIDPQGSKAVLVDALRATGRNAYWIRQCAAEALANVEDPAVAQVLEAEAQTERDDFIKSKLQQAAASVRANAAAKQKEP